MSMNGHHHNKAQNECDSNIGCAFDILGCMRDDHAKSSAQQESDSNTMCIFPPCRELKSHGDESGAKGQEEDHCARQDQVPTAAFIHPKFRQQQKLKKPFLLSPALSASARPLWHLRIQTKKSKRKCFTKSNKKKDFKCCECCKDYSFMFEVKFRWN